MPFDDYASSEYLPEQTSSGAVLTFNFTKTVHQLWVEMSAQDSSAVGRIRADGEAPTSTQGIPARDKIPVPITVTAQTVKVLAPEGAAVNVWGFRR